MTPPPNSAASVVIPVLNVERYLPMLLDAIAAQRPVPPREVVLVDSSSTDRTPEIAAATPGVRLVPIARFSHGRARNLGAATASGEIVVFVTGDALPAGPTWLSCLLAPLADAEVAASYSRQTPRADADPIERRDLERLFPASPAVVRRIAPGASPSYEDASFSDVSSAVRRSLLLRHPFDEELPLAEDRQLARDLLRAGHAVAYAPESVVVHSHRYSFRRAFRRHRDAALALRRIFPERPPGRNPARIAGIFVTDLAYVWKTQPSWLPGCLAFALARNAGVLAARLAPARRRPASPGPQDGRG
jgi:rhamnosyltransferase